MDDRTTAERSIDRSRGTSPWRLPTRRAFVTMIGAAAAALAAPNQARLVSAIAPSADAPSHQTPRPTTPTRWIGHC